MVEGIRREDSTRVVWVPHSEAKKAELSDKLAKADANRKVWETSMKSVVSRFKQKIKEAKAKVDEAFLAVVAQGEEQEVEVEVTWDYRQNRYTVANKETGEIYEERALTAAERQAELDLEPPTAGPPPANRPPDRPRPTGGRECA